MRLCTKGISLYLSILMCFFSVTPLSPVYADEPITLSDPRSQQTKTVDALSSTVLPDKSAPELPSGSLQEPSPISPAMPEDKLQPELPVTAKALVDQLQKNLGKSYSIETRYDPEANEYFVVVHNLSDVQGNGKFKFMKVSLKADGTFSEVKETVYSGVENVDGDLIFKGMSESTQNDINVQNALSKLTEIKIETVNEKGVIYYEQNNQRYMVYRDEQGSAIFDQSAGEAYDLSPGDGTLSQPNEPNLMYSQAERDITRDEWYAEWTEHYRSMIFGYISGFLASTTQVILDVLTSLRHFAADFWNKFKQTVHVISADYVRPVCGSTRFWYSSMGWASAQISLGARMFKPDQTLGAGRSGVIGIILHEGYHAIGGETDSLYGIDPLDVPGEFGQAGFGHNEQYTEWREINAINWIKEHAGWAEIFGGNDSYHFIPEYGQSNLSGYAYQTFLIPGTSTVSSRVYYNFGEIPLDNMRYWMGGDRPAFGRYWWIDPWNSQIYLNGSHWQEVITGPLFAETFYSGRQVVFNESALFMRSPEEIARIYQVAQQTSDSKVVPQLVSVTAGSMTRGSGTVTGHTVEFQTATIFVSNIINPGTSNETISLFDGTWHDFYNNFELITSIEALQQQLATKANTITTLLNQTFTALFGPIDVSGSTFASAVLTINGTIVTPPTDPDLLLSFTTILKILWNGKKMLTNAYDSVVEFSIAEVQRANELGLDGYVLQQAAQFMTNVYFATRTELLQTQQQLTSIAQSMDAAIVWHTNAKTNKILQTAAYSLQNAITLQSMLPSGLKVSLRYDTGAGKLLTEIINNNTHPRGTFVSASFSLLANGSLDAIQSISYQDITSLDQQLLFSAIKLLTPAITADRDALIRLTQSTIYSVEPTGAIHLGWQGKFYKIYRNGTIVTYQDETPLMQTLQKYYGLSGLPANIRVSVNPQNSNEINVFISELQNGVMKDVGKIVIMTYGGQYNISRVVDLKTGTQAQFNYAAGYVLSSIWRTTCSDINCRGGYWKSQISVTTLDSSTSSGTATVTSVSSPTFLVWTDATSVSFTSFADLIKKSTDMDIPVPVAATLSSFKNNIGSLTFHYFYVTGGYKVIVTNPTAIVGGLSRMEFVVRRNGTIDLTTLQLTYKGATTNLTPNGSLLFEGMKLLQPGISDVAALTMLPRISNVQAGSSGSIKFVYQTLSYVIFKAPAPSTQIYLLPSVPLDSAEQFLMTQFSFAPNSFEYISSTSTTASRFGTSVQGYNIVFRRGSTLYNAFSDLSGQWIYYNGVWYQWLVSGSQATIKRYDSIGRLALMTQYDNRTLLWTQQYYYTGANITPDYSKRTYANGDIDYYNSAGQRFVDALLDRTTMTEIEFNNTKNAFPYIRESFGNMTYAEFIAHAPTTSERNFLTDLIAYAMNRDAARFGQLLSTLRHFIILTNPSSPHVGGGYGVAATATVTLDLGSVPLLNDNTKGGMASFMAHEMAHVYCGVKGICNSPMVASEKYARAETVRWMEMLGSPQVSINEEKYMIDVAGDGSTEGTLVQNYYFANGISRERAIRLVWAAQLNLLASGITKMVFESSRVASMTKDSVILTGRELTFQLPGGGHKTVFVHAISDTSFWVFVDSSWHSVNIQMSLINNVQSVIQSLITQSTEFNARRAQDFSVFSQEINAIGATFAAAKVQVFGTVIEPPMQADTLLTYNTLKKMIWNWKCLAQNQFDQVVNFESIEMQRAQMLGLSARNPQMMIIGDLNYKSEAELQALLAQLNSASQDLANAMATYNTEWNERRLRSVVFSQFLPPYQSSAILYLASMGMNSLQFISSSSANRDHFGIMNNGYDMVFSYSGTNQNIFQNIFSDLSGGLIYYNGQWIVNLQGTYLPYDALFAGLRQEDPLTQITAAQFLESVQATAQNLDLVAQAYAFMTDPVNHILPAGASFPVLFLKGINLTPEALSQFAMSSEAYDIVVMPLEPFLALPQDSMTRRNWIVPRVAHEATHSVDVAADPNVAILVSEANAYAATFQAVRVLGASPDIIARQEKTAAAFSILSGNPQIVAQIFGTGIQNFRFVGYESIQLPGGSVVRISLHWNGQTKLVDVDVAAPAGSQISVVQNDVFGRLSVRTQYAANGTPAWTQQYCYTGTNTTPDYSKRTYANGDTTDYYNSSGQLFVDVLLSRQNFSRELYTNIQNSFRSIQPASYFVTTTYETFVAEGINAQARNAMRQMIALGMQTDSATFLTYLRSPYHLVLRQLQEHPFYASASASWIFSGMGVAIQATVDKVLIFYCDLTALSGTQGAASARLALPILAHEMKHSIDVVDDAAHMEWRAHQVTANWMRLLNFNKHDINRQQWLVDRIPDSSFHGLASKLVTGAIRDVINPRTGTFYTYAEAEAEVMQPLESAEQFLMMQLSLRAKSFEYLSSTSNTRSRSGANIQGFDIVFRYNGISYTAFSEPAGQWIYYNSNWYQLINGVWVLMGSLLSATV
ncbi:MAG TPA: hypothetical protein PLO78_05775 [Candidatus Omnitrophota bacterium]|nr:hypothetical protein [Candidatus Omnitrophota bacterium]